MQRRTFLKTSAAASLAGVLGCQHRSEPAGDAKSGQPQGENSPEQGHLTYASPLEAMKAPPEKLAYVTCTYAGTETNKPDYLATVDLDPKSKTYRQIVHRTSMPTAGDELHHFGWNACSSCFGKASASRRYLVVPGLVSGRIHIIDTIDAAAPKMHKVIEADEIKKKTKLSAPHIFLVLFTYSPVPPIPNEREPCTQEIVCVLTAGVLDFRQKPQERLTVYQSV